MGGVAQRGVAEQGKRGLERFIRAVGSVTDRGFFPLREAITGRMEGDMLAGPATELIGNLLARPPAGGRIRGSGTDECLGENKNRLSSGFLAMRKRYAEWVVARGQLLTAQEDRREGTGTEYMGRCSVTLKAGWECPYTWTSIRI